MNAKELLSLDIEIKKLTKTERRYIKEKIEKLYPFEIASKLNVYEANNIVKSLGNSKSERKIIRRHFRNSRNLKKFGTIRPNQKNKKRRLTYEEYINGKIWEKRKNNYYKKYGRKCKACNSIEYVHLHHMVYHSYTGNEPDNHLVPLCQEHHNQYHELYGTKKRMVKTTMEFIEYIKNSLQC